MRSSVCRTAAPVRCHQPALEHALQEIITNALQVHTDDIVVTITIDQDSGGGVRVRFRDSGPGFAEESALHATEPFYTTRNTGIGLGLTIAQKIIEDHHGRLSLAPRSGTRDFDVEVRLPAAEGV